MGKVIRICMFCKEVVGEKSDGKEGDLEDETASLCDPCLDKHFPQEAPKVKIMRRCDGCKDKTWKCELMACNELSKQLDELDIKLKAIGI